MLGAIWSRLQNLPSIAWVFLFPLGLIAFIGGIIFLFVGLATVEGFATVIFLIVGWLMAMGMVSLGRETKGAGAGILSGGVICFYALMGMAIDQPGNPIFNAPLGWFCPSGTHLNRSVTVLHPLPGRTDMIQSFKCLDENDKRVEEVSMFKIIGVRFFEYVGVAYAFIAINTLLQSSRTIRAKDYQPERITS